MTWLYEHPWLGSASFLVLGMVLATVYGTIRGR